jgi:hypothetical protein
MNQMIRIDRRLMMWYGGRGARMTHEVEEVGLERIVTGINKGNRQWRRREIATSGERWGTQIVWDLSAFLFGNKSVKTRLEWVELKVHNERNPLKIGSRGHPPVDLQ